MAKWNWKMASLGVVTSMSLVTVGFAGPVKTAVASLGARPYLQIHVAASATGSGASGAKLAKLLNALSFDIDEQSVTGAAISTSAKNVNTRLDLKVGETTLATIIEVGANTYVNADISGFSKVPGISLPVSQLAALQFALGGRWFEFPTSLIKKSLPKSGTPKGAGIAATRVLDRELTAAFTTLLNHTQFVKSANGVYSKSGTIASLWSTIVPILQRAGLKSSLPNTQPVGTYATTLATSGSTATSASVALSLNDGAKGQIATKFSATFEHATYDVTAPSGASVVTSSMLSTLLGLASGTTTTTLG